MSPRRKTTSEFEQYQAASTPRAETRGPAEGEESVNAFTFDTELDLSQTSAEDALPVVETVKAALIFPDEFQPRPSPLPQAVRARFRQGEIDAFQSAREWLRLAEKDPVLLHEVQQYLSMGENMAANGQINPLTGRWEQAAPRKGNRETRIFRIETGEQRFWSAVLHHTRLKLPPDDLTLKVSVVPLAVAPTDIAVVRRQISENRKNMQLTEVLQAREIARLLLATIAEKTGEPFDFNREDEYDYFRAALRLGRVPHGVWEVLQAEFGLGQHRMRQSLEVLNLPSPLLDLAHKTRLSYRALSAILKLPEEQWEQAVWEAALQAIQREEEEPDAEETPGAAGVGKPRSPRTPRKPVDSAELAFRGVRRFYRSAIKGVHNNPLLIQNVADNIIMDGYPEEVIDFMEELVQAVRARLYDDDAKT